MEWHGVGALEERQYCMKASGIYEITNLINGKRYVGSAVNMYRRWYAHRWHLEAKRKVEKNG